MTDERLCTWLVLLVTMVLSRQHWKLMHWYDTTFMHIYVWLLLFVDSEVQIFEVGVYTSHIESHCHIVWECVINTVPSSQSFLCTEDVSFHRFCCMRKPSIWTAWGSQTSNCCARESRTRKDQALYTSILKNYVKIMVELWRTSQKHGRNWRTWFFSHLFHHVSKSSIFIWSTNPPLHHVFHERSWQFWAHAFDGGRWLKENFIYYDINCFSFFSNRHTIISIISPWLLFLLRM